jgi:hypothetical protein
VPTATWRRRDWPAPESPPETGEPAKPSGGVVGEALGEVLEEVFGVALGDVGSAVADPVVGLVEVAAEALPDAVVPGVPVELQATRVREATAATAASARRRPYVVSLTARVSTSVRW